MFGQTIGVLIGNGGAAASPTLSIVLTDSADVTPAGNNFSFTVQVDNLATTLAATSLTCTVTLDSSLTYVSASGTGWSLSHSGHTVTATLSSLAADAAANPITITVTAGNVAMTASTAATVSAVNVAAASTSKNTTVQLPVLTQTIVDSGGGTVYENTSYAYTVQVDNISSQGAANVISVAVMLDPSLTYTSASGTGWTCSESGGVVTCTRSTLAAATNAGAITITVTAGGSTGSITSTAVLTAANCATVTTPCNSTVVVGIVFGVTVTPSVASALNGGAYSYATVVTQTGPGDALSVSVTITLDSKETYVSSSGTGWTLSQLAGVVTATMASTSSSIPSARSRRFAHVWR